MNALDDPQTYANPDLTADLVMKGGITSGIVFPRAMCELARRYRFHQIGGTSAGAIAAGVAAAAEHGRSQGRPASFVGLAALPSWLGGRNPTTGQSRLLELFQPAANLRSLFELLLAVIGGERASARIAQILRLLLFHFGARPWIGMIPGLLLLALWIAFPPQGGVGPLLSAVAVLLVTALGFLIGSVLALSDKVLREVPENLFGICTGNRENPDAPALTPWLHERIQDLAGRTPEDDPLTFEDLEAGEYPVELRVMTTCLTLGRPYLLPFDTQQFYFDPDELGRLFPESVVAFMRLEAERWSADPKLDKDDQWVNRFLHPRLPLPPGKMPILVGVRMSLSFPVLLSAVPLWTLDWSSQSNQDAREEWREWARSHDTEWESLRTQPGNSPPEGAPAIQPRAERLWFSDGGICSNFPVHLFDSLVPEAPTFAINLKYGADAAAKESRIELAESHNDGLLERWSRFGSDPDEPGGSLSGFLGAMLGTMQNWTDNTMLKLPGYRDRIAHLHLAPEEGGLNLDMTSDQVGALAGWGEEAGARLRERFTNENAKGNELSWDNHRWARLRSSLAFFQDLVEQMVEVYKASDTDAAWRSYRTLIERSPKEKIPPTSYKWRWVDQPKLAVDTFTTLEKLVEDWKGVHSAGFHDPDVPKPRPELHIRPPLRK